VTPALASTITAGYQNGRITMTALRLRLDHTGTMVRDLAAGAERWRRLGFTLAPKSPQMGFVRPGGPMEPWATANHCAMFRQGYLELIGIHKPEAFNPWAKFMDRFEGTHICAFRCDDADAAYAVLKDRAPGLDPPVQRRRDAPFGEGTREFRFRNIFSRDDKFPEGRFIVIEHQTPEVIWQEALMEHANGAVALTEVMFCADDMAATAGRLAGILGSAPVPAGTGTLHFTMPEGARVTVHDAAAFRTRFPGAEPPPRPCMAGVTVAFADVEAAARLMSGNGVAVRPGPAGSWIGAEDDNGAVMAMAKA